MKTKLTILIIIFGLAAGLAAQESKEPFFSQVVASPDKTALNFNVFLFHHKYRWVESKTEGKYSVVSLVIQNNKNAKLLNWRDYKVYFLLKDGTLFHNYTTRATSGNYSCNYTVAPGQQHVQLICFGRKFEPEQVDRAWLRMTASNFIKLLYKSKYNSASQSSGIRPASLSSPGSFRTVNSSGSRMAEAKALLRKFLQPGADYEAMSKQLRPSETDYRAYFVSGSWQKAMAEYNKMWDQSPGAITPKEGQTELLLWQATVDELKNGTGYSRNFPGGYQKASHHIQPGHTIYRFKFVRPGKTLGMAYDGLVFINGHWVFIPKPWRVVN
jgi:hypothetical protein